MSIQSQIAAEQVANEILQVIQNSEDMGDDEEQTLNQVKARAKSIADAAPDKYTLPPLHARILSHLFWPNLNAETFNSIRDAARRVGADLGNAWPDASAVRAQG